MSDPLLATKTNTSPQRIVSDYLEVEIARATEQLVMLDDITMARYLQGHIAALRKARADLVGEK